MSMKDWAAREVEIACKREAPDRKEGEWDYGCACYESALKAYNSLLEDEHSGMSWSITRSILIRLMNGQPLTPIEDVPEVWNLVYTDDDGTNRYQCRRMSSLFKDVHPDGMVNYNDINRVSVFEVGSKTSWHCGFIREMIDKMYPITMPYRPKEKPYKVYVEELLTDRKNGDYDTMAVLYVMTPDGDKVQICKHYGETDDGWQEITEEEYNNRKILHLQRELREKREAEAHEDH